MQPAYLISISQVASSCRKELVEDTRSTSKVSNSKKVKSRIFTSFHLDEFEFL